MADGRHFQNPYILPYLNEKSSDFDEILYAAADFELDEHHVIKNKKKLHWTDSEFDRTYLLLNLNFRQLINDVLVLCIILFLILHVYLDLTTVHA